MSFQGDVGGIGLADLLQSLARGREGVLSLLCKDGTRATIGVANGQLHLLPDPEEEPETWRARTRRAWVKDPDFRIDSLRMADIARAQRTETLFRLLDSEGVHFRFAPGPLPERASEPQISNDEPGTQRPGVRSDAIFVPAVSAEALLLEYARLKDEGLGQGNWYFVSDNLVPVLAGDARAKGDLAKLLSECDGESTTAEIADRLGWPARQTRILVVQEIQKGLLRFKEAAEILPLAEQELALGHTERAAARLEAWHALAPPHSLATVDAEALRTEFQAGRLTPALRTLKPRVARALLRRIDFALGDVHLAIEYWGECARSTVRPDRIAQLRLFRLQARSGADPALPAVKEMLAFAHQLLDEKRKLAAAAVLLLVNARAPESTSVRLDLGNCWISAGRPREAGPWIVAAAKRLLDEGNPERAFTSLRTLVELDPQNRDARRLYAKARAKTVQRTLVKKNSLITISILLALSIGAVVQVRKQHDRDEKFEAVQALVGDPSVALTRLEELFAGEDDAEIAALRAELAEKCRLRDLEARTSWMDRYREAQTECTLGDPILGLRRALEMPEPPRIMGSNEPWPLVADLYNGLAARIETDVQALGSAMDDTPGSITAEKRLLTLVGELVQGAGSPEAASDAGVFATRMRSIAAELVERDEKRAEARARSIKQDNLAKQDLLLMAARAHAEAGDHERALATYAKLVEMDTTGKLEGLLAAERKKLQERSDAVALARELALSGKHGEAKKVLFDALENPTHHLLPWRVQSFPKGARARLSNGSERVTPFSVETAFGEKLTLSFELDGHEPMRLSIEEPADHFLWFSRAAERAWRPEGRIEAPPVAVGDDHVVADRRGKLARLAKGGEIVWTIDLGSLGGIARAPVFLPKRPGNLLVVTEDGDVWIVDAASGATEGPWSAGTPPAVGPYAVGGSVRVEFRGGAKHDWRARLKPEDEPAATDAEDSAGTAGVDAGLAMLRRTNGATRLESPWTEDVLTIEPEIFSVRARGATEPRFTVRREGDWSYVAFEAPRTQIPRGRLWISDARGLRSYAP